MIDIYRKNLKIKNLIVTQKEQGRVSAFLICKSLFKTMGIWQITIRNYPIDINQQFVF